MTAHRLHVTVPENRRAIVEFPESVPAGEVEIIVLVSPDARPITQEMVQKALEEERTEPAPLPLLRDPVPVEGIDLDDTSQLWDLK